MKSICLDEEGFWKEEAQLLEIFGPIVKLLCLTDSALSAMSKVRFHASQHKATSLVQNLWPAMTCHDYFLLQVCFYCSLF